MTAGAHVVVVGGGLAGLTAAIALAETGHRVTVLESRPRLGGATCSFSRGDLVIDNGQHVFLRCCTAYRGLLARLGMTGSVRLQDRFDVTVLSPGGGRATLRRTVLPGPLHMARALTGYSHLSFFERIRVVPAALAMALLDPGRPGLDDERLGDWLAARGQGERARRVLWDLFTVSSLNVPGDDANLALAATVVKTALLSARDAADIGVPEVPLGDLHGRAAAELLARLGARVRLGAKVGAVAALPAGGFLVRLVSRDTAAGPPENGHYPQSSAGDLVFDDGARPAPGPAPPPEAGPADGAADGAGELTIRADGVVLAVPPEAAGRLVPQRRPGLPQQPSGNGAGPWGELGASPIVNVHVVYDRRVTRLPFAAAVDSPVQWVFDRTGPSGLRRGQYLAVSLSAADQYVNVPAARLREDFLRALADLFPEAARARVVDCFVTRERRATFRQEPGCGRLRPGAETSQPGLVLAGAWTDTGWPDTMEGAVRSGLIAARELRHALAGGPASRWGPRRSPARAASAGQEALS